MDISSSYSWNSVEIIIYTLSFIEEMIQNLKNYDSDDSVNILRALDIIDKYLQKNINYRELLEKKKKIITKIIHIDPIKQQEGIEEIKQWLEEVRRCLLNKKDNHYD